MWHMQKPGQQVAPGKGWVFEGIFWDRTRQTNCRRAQAVLASLQLGRDGSSAISVDEGATAIQPYLSPLLCGVVLSDIGLDASWPRLSPSRTEWGIQFWSRWHAHETWKGTVCILRAGGMRNAAAKDLGIPMRDLAVSAASAANGRARPRSCRWGTGALDATPQSRPEGGSACGVCEPWARACSVPIHTWDCPPSRKADALVAASPGAEGRFEGQLRRPK